MKEYFTGLPGVIELVQELGWETKNRNEFYYKLFQKFYNTWNERYRGSLITNLPTKGTVILESHETIKSSHLFW